MGSMPSSEKRSRLAVQSMLCVIAIFVFGYAADSARAQVQAFRNTPDMQIASHTLRQKAPADECFAYLANPSPLPKFTDPTKCSTYPVPFGMPTPKPKVNQGYIWGLTEYGDSVWWGTFANGNCVTQAGSVPGTGNPNGAPNAHLTLGWVCEYYDSPYYPSPIADARIGDFRPPRIYEYSKSKKRVTDRTPKYPVFVSPNDPEGIQLNLFTTRGIRSAVSINGLIILAGPSLDPTRGLNVFAWDANTGAFLGARPLPGYNNIRQFLVIDGVAYTAVGKNQCSGSTCTATVIGGRVLRMEPTIIPGCTYSPVTGNPTPPPCFLLNGGNQTNPDPPAEVGNLDTVAGSLTIHNGRIYTVTWPHQDLPGAISSLYQSPVVPAGGLTAADATQWVQRWKSSDYEPDSGMAQFYAGGAVASFDGYLWWGTLHIPMQPALALMKMYPPNTAQEALQDLAGTFRATVFFRGKDLETANPQIDLVYGNERLPVFTPPANGQPQSWALQTNKMKNPKAMWGSSGFGNPWNTYTWSATVWNDRLWIGTMDWSMNAQQGSAMMAALGFQVPTELFTASNFGGDLLYFTSASRPAFPESTDGLDNQTNFGIRNQIASSNGNLFLGMANGSNLATDPNDPKRLGGMGGWELIELSPLPTLNTPTGINVDVTMDDGTSVKYCNVSKSGWSFSTTLRNPFAMTLPVHPFLTPFNLVGPPLPLNVASPPPKIVLMWSSALWGQGCTSPNLAQVSASFGTDIPIPRLLQLQWDGDGYIWKDITTEVNYSTKKVTGAITGDYIGILGVAQLAMPSLTGSISSKGFDQKVGGSYYVDLTITNSGRGAAKNITVDTLTFKTLNGTGVVTYNSPPGPPLPISTSLVELPPGASTTVRLYLKSSTYFNILGVWRFSIASGIKMTDLVGNPLSVTLTQTVLQ